ncbi:MAG: response regulator transcription factor [Clostridiales bacterium]|jgi:DNA-binding response OmpR family regulator|nr:response regulator transcription factor [Clostridiales bacterium]
MQNNKPPQAQKKRICVVEDDATIAVAVRDGLLARGFEAMAVEDFEDVLGRLRAFAPDLVLMDISLPFYNGYYWCARLRETEKTPVIFLSSRSEDMDIVMAMQLGGDDYIVKPFSMEVLIARVQAVLRRAKQAAWQYPAFMGATLLAGEAALQAGQTRIELTKNELRIMQLLLSKKGAVVPREDIMLALWDSDSYIDDNTLTVNMNRLRKKLAGAGLGGCIHTRRGEGYMLNDGFINHA